MNIFIIHSSTLGNGTVDSTSRCPSILDSALCIMTVGTGDLGYWGFISVPVITNARLV